jgi:fibronectin type 3 domain-containing protein
MVPAGTVCHPSADMNQCDPAEFCTGTSVSCPDDVVYTRPSVPTAVAAVPGTMPGTAAISWTPVPGATGYNVKRSATSGLGYTTQGSPPTTPDASYVNLGLTGGVTYYYLVSAVNTILTCESIGSPEVTVIPTGVCTPPAAPSVTPAATNGRISLTWTASTGATSYSVGRSETAGTGYLSVTTVTTGTSYDDSNVANGTTYYYVVTASNGTCSSGNSLEVHASPSCTPPAAPTNLGAVANNAAVKLTWDLVTGAVSYRVLRSTSLGSDYVLVGTSGVASYTDTSVTNGTTYYYVVTASNGLCNSVNSLPMLATPACTPPSKPANLVAKPGNDKIDLTWDPSAGGAISYQVRRSTTAGGPYAVIFTPTTTGYTDTDVVNGTTYYYVVNANGSCPSAPSAEVSAAPVCTPPTVPTLTAAPGDGQVTLSWTAATGTSVSYVVARGSASGGPYTDIPSPSLTVTTYTDLLLTNGTTYYYVVKASNGTCFSTSAERPAKPVAACAQAAPTGLTATAGNKQVTLTWTAPAGATSYTISRSTTSATGYATAGTVNAPPFVDTDAALVNDTKYYYVVSASNGTCTSRNSVEVSATPVCIPPAVPANVAAKADNSNGRITVSWDAVNGATGYTVTRGVSGSGPFVAASTNQTAATFTDSGLAAGTNYFYVVNASNGAGTCASVYSTPAVSAMSCSSPSVPSNVKATAGISRVTVSWTASTGSPTSYQVKRSTSATGTFTSLGTVTASPYVDSAVTNGTTYYYEVAARNAGGACSSANSGSSSTAPRSCTVWSGNAVNAGHPGAIGSTNGICYVTCDTITNWGCANINGDRTITINGGPLACGGAIPASKTAGYNVIDVSAGPNTQATIFWGGTWVNTCSIPAGGLDF